MTQVIEIIGLEKVEKLIKNLPKDKLELVNTAVHNQGFLLEGEVKASVAGQRAEPTSVDTGQFLNSIRANNDEFLISRVSSDVEHSKYMEYGTSRIAPRGHFRNSLAREQTQIIDAIKQSVG